MLELKTYQRDTLDAFSNWLEVLKEAQNTSETQLEKLKEVGIDIETDLEEDIRNYPKKAWEKLAKNGDVAVTAGEYVDRKDGANQTNSTYLF